ncbi:MAG: hypothetical protein WCD70_03185 [Alphaproteobacteria bacterium]
MKPITFKSVQAGFQSVGCGIMRDPSVLSFAAVVSGVVTMAACVPLVTSAAALASFVFVGGFLGSKLHTASHVRAARAVWLATPLLGVAAFGALVPTSLANHRAHVTAVSQFKAATVECTSAKGQVVDVGDKGACMYINPAKPDTHTIKFDPRLDPS